MDQFAKTLLQNTPQWVQMLAKDRGHNVKPGLGARGQWANSICSFSGCLLITYLVQAAGTWDTSAANMNPLPLGSSYPGLV